MLGNQNTKPISSLGMHIGLFLFCFVFCIILHQRSGKTGLVVEFPGFLKVVALAADDHCTQSHGDEREVFHVGNSDSRL